MPTPLLIVSLVLFSALSACAAPTPAARTALPADSSETIYVVRRDWHTGIAVPARAWPEGRVPLLADFPGARYLEFGWGDATYYQAEEKTLRMTLAAVLWPTDSVMEVLGLQRVGTTPAPDYEVVELQVSATELAALTAAIARSFAAELPRATGTISRSAQGLGRFYHAGGRFHFFRMCNRWTVERLQAAGCPTRPWPVITAAQALAEARRCQAGRTAPLVSRAAHKPLARLTTAFRYTRD